MSFLKSITIKNFRSIGEDVHVPLDAPVVLIHGNNGAGKTSVLSAIELALTGKIPTLARFDSNYRSFLVHQHAETAMISLKTSTTRENSKPIHFTRAAGVVPHLLDDVASRFFNERCYLAQASLSRLLEIYQSADARLNSPLTTFVKELLHLDRLDAIVDGLNVAGHVTRVKKLVPEYDDLIDTEAQLTKTLTSGNAQLAELKKERQETEAELRTIVGPLLRTPFEALSLEVIRNAISDKTDDDRETVFLGIRRQLESIISQLKNAKRPTAESRIVAELRVKETQEALEAWMNATGRHIELIVIQLSRFFPDIPSITATDPDTVYSTALLRVNSEVSRLESTLKNAAERDLELERVAKILTEIRARMHAIDEQIREIASASSDLGRALVGLLPHITGECCPVCDRNYGEISAEPLITHVSAKVASMTFLAEKLETLNKARQSLAKEAAESERKQDANIATRISVNERGQLMTRFHEIEPYRRQLLTFDADVKFGSERARAAADAMDTLAKVDIRDRLESEAKVTLMETAALLAQIAPQKTETTVEAASRMLSYTLSQEQTLGQRKMQRKNAAAHLQRLDQLDSAIKNCNESLATVQRELSRTNEFVSSAKAIIANAKTMRGAAISARTAIVRDVFNDSLNSLWRELFIRLAPAEPFVPSFKIPEAQPGPVIAELETRYHSGGIGGTPGTMLSAGNLNTAALTLFLSLHLSVEPLIKCLVLDDPVQSMDEVHIAQFAALLRTLSRQLDRQTIIAVHDRPLFDYLALELSPSAPGDRLITIELTKSQMGSTTATSTPHYYEKDPIIFAA